MEQYCGYLTKFLSTYFSWCSFKSLSFILGEVRKKIPNIHTVMDFYPQLYLINVSFSSHMMICMELTFLLYTVQVSTR